jgi:hypothetical protein
VDFYGVAWNGSPDYMIDFIDRHGLSFPSIDDRTGAVFARYDVPFQPAWVFIDEAGDRTRVQGSLDAASLAPYVEQIVGDAS